MTNDVRAISIFSSRTFWLNGVTFLVGALSASEILVLIPIRFMPVVVAIVAMANMWLRTVTVRPVALISPGQTKLVPVETIPPKAND